MTSLCVFGGKLFGGTLGPYTTFQPCATCKINGHNGLFRCFAPRMCMKLIGARITAVWGSVLGPLLVRSPVLSVMVPAYCGRTGGPIAGRVTQGSF
jgi:hypothetical protein